jgi:hypothetical protein
VLTASEGPDAADTVAASIALEVIARALEPRAGGKVAQDLVLQRALLGDVPAQRGDVGRVIRASLLPASTESSAHQWLDARARDLLVHFARSVPGCQDSTPMYLRTNLLSMPATVLADGTVVQIGRPPLDILLGFSGLRRGTLSLPNGRQLRLVDEPGP